MTITVLTIGDDWPDPKTSTSDKHLLSILKLLRQQGWHIVFTSPTENDQQTSSLESEEIATQSITINCDSFNEFAYRLSPDIVLFNSFIMEEQFGWRVDKTCPNAVKILDAQELHCLSYSRQQAVLQDRKICKADFFSHIAKREIAAIFRCDLALVLSPDEINLLQQQFQVPIYLLHHLPFLVDVDHISRPFIDYEHRQHFISIGSFKHSPNWDAILKLKSLWPQIRQQIPNAECHIYTQSPIEKISELHHPDNNFYAKPYQESMNAYLAKARLYLAPLRFGAGLKGKLLEAMQAGTPSITTKIGSEGMHGDLPWPGYISHSDKEFIEAAVRLYVQKEQWIRAQQQGELLLKQLYDSKPLTIALIERIETLLKQLSQHRLNNFTGAMLKHHRHTSTQYLSQWIAEKNRA